MGQLGTSSATELLAMHPWTVTLTFLVFSFFICRMEQQVLKAGKESEIWQPAPPVGSPTKTPSYTENLV